MLGRQDEQGQAEPTRELATATSAYCCPHGCPAADRAKLGGSGEHPTRSAEGVSQNTDHCPSSALQQAAAAALQACKPASSKHLRKRRRTGQLWSLAKEPSVNKDQPNCDHPHPGPGPSCSSLLAHSSPDAGKYKSGGLLPTHPQQERLRCMWLHSTRNCSPCL